ncbi:MAG TPA: aryl sulfotransferase [Firmicutes bacterium]|nr:aryl sulfotransferase [Bacillota bacterium]
MKKRIMIITSIIAVAMLILLVLMPKTTAVEQKDTLIIAQQAVDERLANEIKKDSHTFESPYIELNPYGNSPLTALLLFNTPTDTQVTVTIHGRDELTTFEQTFESSQQHSIPIYGLYPDTENKITLALSTGEKTEITIQTEALPEDFSMPTTVIANKEALTNELYFATPASVGYTAAYDVNGDVRWYLSTNNVWDIKRLQNGNLLLSSNRTVAAPYYMTGLMEMDLLGKVYVEYNMPGGYHHDAFEMENGNLIVAQNNPTKQTVEDYVVEMDRTTGEIIKKWDLTEVLPKDVAKSENWIETDWFHNNSVWYDEATNALILSGRHQDAVISLDYTSGKLNWIIGDSTGWPEEMKSYFFTPVGDEFEWQWSQHAAQVLPNGDVFVFDNGNNRSKNSSDYVSAEDNYSRGVIYHLNTDDMTIEQVYEFGKERGSDFYSPYISDVDYLEENHYLIHSGGIGSVDGKASNVPAYFTPGATLNSITAEVINNEVVYELHLPGHYYRAEKMSLYTENKQHSLTPGTSLGTLGKSTTLLYDLKSSLMQAKPIDAEVNLEMSQEYDRLVVSGDFIEGQNVKLVLSQWNDKVIYDIRVKKENYSAMCIDLFNKNTDPNAERLHVTKFINAEGLSGTYQIYLEIDGVLYETDQHVKF